MAAGAIAKKIPWLYSRVEVIGFVQSVQDIAYEIGEDHDSLTEEKVTLSICMYVCMYVYMYIFTNEEDLSALKTLSVCMYLCMYMHVCIWIILMHNKFFYHYKVEANIVRCPDPIIAEKMI